MTCLRLLLQCMMIIRNELLQQQQFVRFVYYCWFYCCCCCGGGGDGASLKKGRRIPKIDTCTYLLRTNRRISQPVHKRLRIPISSRKSPDFNQCMRRRLTNTPPKTGGKYSYRGRTPSRKHGASIRTVDEYPVRSVGRVFVGGRIAPIQRIDFPSIRQIYLYACGVCKFFLWGGRLVGRRVRRSCSHTLKGGSCSID